MKTIKAYQLSELQPEARIRVEAGSVVYAAQMLLQQNNCPPHMVAKMYDQFRAEYANGWFSLSGELRFPTEAVMVKEETPGAVAPEAAPNGAPALSVIEGEKN